MGTYPNARVLTRKDLLAVQLRRAAQRSVRDGGGLLAAAVMPQTFLLPQEGARFAAAFREAAGAAAAGAASAQRPDELQNVWIYKPSSKSCGRGIRFVTDAREAQAAIRAAAEEEEARRERCGAGGRRPFAKGAAVVVQRYVHRPLLLAGFKFDLRIFVLVTSFQPLVAFVHRRGFARFATTRYSCEACSTALALRSNFAHLCNSSVQRHNQGALDDAHPVNCARALGDDAGGGRAPGEAEAGGGARARAQTHAGGTKTSLAFLWRRLQNEGALGRGSGGAERKVARLKANILGAVAKALIAANQSIPHAPQCFHLFGFDVLVDEALHPWVLEVNAKPSMACGTPLDVQVKAAVAADTLRM
eukprot:g7808.t1